MNVHIKYNVLFIIALEWKQFICTSTGEQVNKMWYIHTVAFYASVKRNEWTIDICYNMDKFQIYHVKRKKQDSKDYILYGCIYAKFYKMKTNL